MAALKHTLEHLMAGTLVTGKPTLNYAELCTLLSRAASVVNDRPIGIKSLTEDELVPLTVNRLLLGRTSSVEPLQTEVVPEGYVAADGYLQDLGVDENLVELMEAQSTTPSPDELPVGRGQATQESVSW